MNSHPPVALITGAARRIGAAIAEHLHAKGYRVVVHYFQSEREALSLTQKLNDLTKDSALALRGDLLAASTYEELIAKTVEWGGQLNLLVNNASIFVEDKDIDAAQWDTLFHTNVRAPFLLSQAAFTHLHQSVGTIINIGDIHAKKPLKNYGIYCQTKAALNMQTKSLAREFAPNVRVNTIAPGAIAWPEDKNTLSDSIKAKIISETPLQFHGKPEFIAKAVSAVIDNEFITGQILAVDGGRSIT